MPARPNKIALFAVRALLLLCLPLFAAQERSVATEHFRFHYPVELRPYAERAAQIAEAVHDTLSRRYEKMYVVRPQCFIPIITLLRNASLKSLQYKKELRIVRNQQLDIQNFEANMQDFKDKFGRNYRLASERFQSAIDEINKSIKALEKTRDHLLASENNLRLANDKAQDLTIRKLTKDSPSLKEAFKEARNQGSGIRD